MSKILKKIEQWLPKKTEEKTLSMVSIVLTSKTGLRRDEVSPRQVSNLDKFITQLQQWVKEGVITLTAEFDSEFTRLRIHAIDTDTFHLMNNAIDAFYQEG